MMQSGRVRVAIAGIFMIAFLICAASVSTAAGYAGDKSRYIPLDHPIYDYLDRLQERGRLLKLNPSLRPYTRLQVLKAIQAQERASLKDVELKWLEILKTECEFELNVSSDNDSAMVAVITRFEGGAQLANLRPDRDQSTAGAGFGGKLSHLVFDTRFLRAPHLLKIRDTTWHRDPKVQAPFEEGLIRLMEGYLKGDFGLFNGVFSTEIFFGRMARNWSPALNNSLILGSDAMSFDHLSLCLRSRHLTFTHLIASMDGMYYQNSLDGPTIRARRYFSAHRLDIRIRDHLRFGITESTVYGGPDRGFDLALSNPFTSYRLTAIQNKNDHANNSFICLDGFFNHGQRLNLFGQFLFDDFLREKNVQDRWAIDLGLNLRDLTGNLPSTLGLRATVVSSFAYNTFMPYERYTLYGRPLGAPLGNDYWKISGFLRLFLTPKLDLAALFSKTSRGSQRIASPIEGLLDSSGLDFPMPPVEKRSQAGISFRWQPLEQAHLEVEGGVLKETQINNQPGINRCRGYARINLALYYDMIISF